MTQVNSEELAAKRTDYYSKWDKFTKEQVSEVEKEDEQLAKESAEKLGIGKGPMSEAEKADMEKRAALREAKKAWEEKQASELNARAVLSHVDEENVLVTDELLEGKRVVHFKNAKNSKFHLPSDLSMRVVKVFIEDCEKCEIVISAVTITSHVEVSHCEDCHVHFKAPQNIIQVDLSKNMEIRFDTNVFKKGEHKVVHAGVTDTKLHFHDGIEEIESTHVDYVSLGAQAKGERTMEEHQFVTHFVDGKLVTEDLFRSKGQMPLTKAEIEKAEREGNGDGLQTDERMAELKKIGGNEAFAEKHYAQAAVYYTEAIDLAPEGSDIIPVCLSNRSFAYSKIGHLEEALKDAEEAVRLKPDYCKALFRKGLALHALKRYREAAISLSKALDLEPKNKQIKEALGFAELRARQAGVVA